MPRGGFIAVLSACAVSLACDSGVAGLDVPRHIAQGLPPAELQGVIFEGYRGEQRELKVTADKATVDLVARVANLDEVTLHFTEDSRGQVEVAAPNGVFKLDEDDFVLSGGVVGSAQAGERFSTETVRYVAANREFVSTTPVELERSHLALRADGMKLGLDERRLRLVGRVKARVAPH